MMDYEIVGLVIGFIMVILGILITIVTILYALYIISPILSAIFFWIMVGCSSISVGRVIIEVICDD